MDKNQMLTKAHQTATGVMDRVQSGEMTHREAIQVVTVAKRILQALHADGAEDAVLAEAQADEMLEAEIDGRG